MKKLILLCLFLSLLTGAHAQEMVQDVTMSVFCKDIKIAKESLNNFLKTNSQIVIFRYDEGSDLDYQNIKKITAVLSANKEDAAKIEDAIKEWGFVSNRQSQTVNNTFEVEKAEMEMDFLNKKKGTYEAEIKATPKENNSYKEYFTEIQSLELQIFELQKKIKLLKNQVRNFSFTINVMEENSAPTGKSNVHFVNMPGLQYSFLNIENAKSSISSDTYQGVSVKYVFTRGKSFIEIGAFKSSTNVPLSDSTRMKELFIYSFGQDFYPTHFGRGSRKFLNLYTGYTLGGIFATSETTSHHTAHITPRIGLEIFKSKSILLDSNVGYFIPFYQNLNLRGIMFNISFNFLF